MNIAELKEAIEDLDDDLEVRVNLFNKITVGVEAVDFTTYVDTPEEIACIIMEGDDELTNVGDEVGVATVVADPPEETVRSFTDRMNNPEQIGPADAARAVTAAHAAQDAENSVEGILRTAKADKEGDAQPE